MGVEQTAIVELFQSSNATVLNWQQASPCTGVPGCPNPETKAPLWGCSKCGGTGVALADAVQVLALFRSQEKWLGKQPEGEYDLGQAQLTTPAVDITLDGVTYPACKPGYVDRYVRDRFTVVHAAGDTADGRVFVPAAHVVPFIWAGATLGWRVLVQSLADKQRVVPTP